MSSVMFEDINSSLKMLEMAFESSYNPIVITDAMLEEPGPRFVYVNPAFTKMTGWELEEIVDKTPRILQGKKSDRATLDELKKRCKKGEYFSGRTTNYKKDGSEYIVEWNVSPVFSKDGEIIYYLSFQKDVTSEVQAKKKEDEFMKFQGMAMKAVGITHILNTELTKIKGRLELVEMVVKSSSLRLYDELEADLEPLRQALRNIGFLSASIRCLSDVKDESKESVDVVEVLLEAIRYKDIDSEGLEIFIDKINYKKPYSLDIYTHKRSLFMVFSLVLKSIIKDIIDITKSYIAIDISSDDLNRSIEVDFKVASKDLYKNLQRYFENPLCSNVRNKTPELFTNIFIASKVASDRDIKLSLNRVDDFTVVKLEIEKIEKC